MAKFRVIYAYQGKVAVEIEAESEDEAEKKGSQEADEMIASNLTCYDASVERID